ncbi:MAG: transglutaminase-like domain-containing protein [Ramlibacter sp.]|nr:transglutaminase-like domain-containing protein [Ramlibacter sp.]
MSVGVPQASLRAVRLNVLMTNPFGHDLKQQTLWMYLPVLAGSHTRVIHQEASGGHSFLSDALGHNILELRLDRLAPYAHRVFNVLVLLESVHDQQGAKGPPEPGMWLGPQRNIESDHPLIAEAAAPLRRPTSRESALEAYRWVASRMTYTGYLSEDSGALIAFRTRRGDCTEYSSLLVALCRACGVPARRVGGYVSDRSIAPRPSDFHDWAEVWIEGRWRIADAQLQNWLTAEERYIPLRYYWDYPINPLGLAHRYRIFGEATVNL